MGKPSRLYVLQSVDNTGIPDSPSAVDVSLQLSLEATAKQLTSVYVFLAGDAISQLNSNLNQSGKSTHATQAAMHCLQWPHVFDVQM